MANEQNLRPSEYHLTQEEAKKGGIASGIARRERKRLADTLRAELEKSAGGGMTKWEFIVAKCLQELGTQKVTPKDLRTIVEVVGELKQNIDITSDGEPLAINVSVVRSREQADEILKAREAKEAL